MTAPTVHMVRSPTNLEQSPPLRYNEDMTLRAYLILMTIATLAFWFAFGIIITTVDPATAQWSDLLLFYGLLIAAITGIGALLGFVVRFLALKQELVVRSVLVAFRQALVAAILISAILFLFSKNLFSWINLGLLILALSTLEFFLLSYESEQLTKSDPHSLDSL